MSANLFGWDLLYGSVSSDVTNNADVLVCFTHYVLISKGFSCIGIGEDKVLDGNEQKSEQLPLGWNSDDYALRYVYEGRLYHFRATPVDDTIQLNLIRVDERKISLVSLNLRMVLKRSGPVADMIPNSADIVQTIETQLIAPVITSTRSKHQETQTAVQGQQPTTRTSPGPSRNPGERPMRPPVHPLMEPRRPVGVGSADLDPFFGGRDLVPGGGGRFGGGGFGGGGGMLFTPPGAGGPGRDPFGMGGPQRGVPPGARFDPFFPPDADVDGNQRRPRNPGSDEFPPPGFEDMFM